MKGGGPSEESTWRVTSLSRVRGMCEVSAGIRRDASW